jgi:uracil-DNA glycosylase
MLEWDPGPTPAIRSIFYEAPLSRYIQWPDIFRLEWGPIYYRGRTDGSARILVIGQDPAADENLARRILVGEAGQRVQGLLSKLGITRSYIMINSVLYSIYGQFGNKPRDFMDIPSIKAWRNSLLDALATPNVQAILAFGLAARHVTESWPGAGKFQNQGKLFYLTHPTAAQRAVRQNWNASMVQIAKEVSPDSDGHVELTPYYGSRFTKSDLSRIPLFDFGFGAPLWMGTGRMAVRLKANKALPKKAIERPTILWTALDNKG